jgi:Acetyltransferase (GNAT) domain
MLTSKVHTGWETLSEINSDWDGLLRTCQKGVSGPDTTCSSLWAQALVQTHLKNADVFGLSLSSVSGRHAVLPLFRTCGQGSLAPRREIRAMTEAHAGRSGLLVRNNDAALVEALLRHVQTDLEPWDIFTFSVVEGSPSHTAVVKAARSIPLRLRCIATGESPFIALESNWGAMLSALPKKFRWTVRKSEKELSSKGSLQYEQADKPASTRSLLDNIYAIERRSWKEESGTSITAQDAQQAFYEALVPIAADAGILSAHILRLDDQPIAYILGLVGEDGVFLDLKESFDLTYSESSPGHVLKRFAIEALIASGIGLYDFMGKCEPYKMRWTDRTYRRLTITMFGRSFRSEYFYLRSRLSGSSKSVPIATS